LADDAKLTGASLFLAAISSVAELEIVHPDDECSGRACTPHGALRMAKALSKVLELHARQKVSRRWWDWVCDRHRREGWPLDDMIACADCKHRDVFFCGYTGCEEVWPCATAEAIERELLGESAATTHQRREGVT
jgi:hypothetical protein